MQCEKQELGHGHTMTVVLPRPPVLATRSRQSSSCRVRGHAVRAGPVALGEPTEDNQAVVAGARGYDSLRAHRGHGEPQLTEPWWAARGASTRLEGSPRLSSAERCPTPSATRHGVPRLLTRVQNSWSRARPLASKPAWQWHKRDRRRMDNAAKSNTTKSYHGGPHGCSMVHGRQMWWR